LEILPWLYGPEKFPGLSRNGPLARDIVLYPIAGELTLRASLHPGVQIGTSKFNADKTPTKTVEDSPVPGPVPN